MGDILMLCHRVPFPPDRGDKVRAYHLLRHLSARARVHLLAFADDPRDLGHDGALSTLAASHRVIWRGKGQGRAAVEALAKGVPVSIAAFDHPEMREAVASALAGGGIDRLFVFSGQMAQYLPDEDAPELRRVMDFVDMDSAKFGAYARARSGPMRWMMAREERLLRGFEAGVADRVDASLFVSEAEAALFRQVTGAARVQAVENGIDTDVFDPAADFARVEEAGPLIVFTGQMDYRPNIDAVDWFARNVLPRVRRAHTDTRFAIVGRKPPVTVAALAKLPGVVVTGEVADVRGWLAAAHVAVAPLQLARGVQNKVLEAMAMARPVVASPAAAEGIDHRGTIRSADGAGSFADAVCELLRDPAAAAALGARARAQVVARYGWDARLAALDPLLGLAPAPAELTAA